jgi:predicted transcriptional regulator of viral defense system
MNKTSKFQYEMKAFKDHGGMLRTSQALEAGIHPRDLYAMKSQGIVEPISRGFYRLKSRKPLWNPDLTTVALRIPQGVICLISALSFHNITTEIPHEVYIALKKGSEKPRLGHPPTRFFWLSPPAFEASIETHEVDGVAIRIYSPEKTVADCFKFRNTVGLDVAIEALKFCRERKRSTVGTLLKCARMDRVEKVMKPYLEAIL